MRPKAKDSAGVSVKSNKVLLSEAANSGDLESLKSILSTLPEDEGDSHKLVNNAIYITHMN